MSEPAWYCIHTKPKCEHLAAAVLGTLPGVEPYCPRIRFQRNTQRGKVWFVEALFPSYLFARFSLSENYRAVKHAQNVLRILEFGGQCISIADRHIGDLRQEMDGQEIREVKPTLKVGDAVELTEGPMRGFKGIIERFAAGEDRVRILLEFLGRQSFVEVDTSVLLQDKQPRTALAKKG